MRRGADALTIDPFLPPQLPGVDITGVKRQGRTFVTGCHQPLRVRPT
ncbi:hypothetical protein [Streptomyces sp. NPDC002324]